MGTCFLREAVDAKDLAAEDSDALVAMLKTCAQNLQQAFAQLDPEWGLVNRHVRGEVNLPIAVGPDILRAVYGSGLVEDGFLTNVAGDGLYYLVAWDGDGRLSVQGVHQYGSATLDEASPHFADQAADFVNEVLHPPLFEEAALQENLLRAYRPGEELSISH